ncbi:IS3 family transposase, partial [Ligilactobacillus equi]
RVDQKGLPKNKRYGIGELLRMIGLKRATYYDERKRIANKIDKYADVKLIIKEIAEKGKWMGNYTYGYRRILPLLQEAGYHMAEATLRRLMSELGVQPAMYNRRKNDHYSSYKGTIGKVAQNLLNQTFDATNPYTVLHTDVSQIRLGNSTWAYMSIILDQATKEVLAASISQSPNKLLITDTLKQLENKLPEGVNPIIHSDQGWHYQLDYYREKIDSLGLIQSMSRKGNCLDNAPMESFFHLFKIESLPEIKSCKDIAEFTWFFRKYIKWYNNDRISNKTKNMSPVDYRTHVLAA